MADETATEDLQLAPARTVTPPRIVNSPSRRRIWRAWPREGWRDAYHVLLTIPLAAFFAVMAGAFLAINGLFASLYMLDPGGIEGARPGKFADVFFFSVQTLGSLGYGVMAPRTLYTNAVATAETFVGLFNLAIATGLLFARISRPTARIVFSDKAVICDFDGVPTLMFRAANRRGNRIVEAEVSVSLLRDTVTREGDTMRRFEELALVRRRTPLFGLSWTVMHAIDAQSPLYGQTRQSLMERNAEIVVVMNGLDETFVSTIHARTSYTPDEIHWGRRLADIFTVDPTAGWLIDFKRFHELA
jgi:inward rectifier potassium channel